VQVIIYLDTGAGKTLISVFLAKHILDTLDRNNLSTDGAVVFLVPTVLLVQQQASYFGVHLARRRIGECVVHRLSAHATSRSFSQLVLALGHQQGLIVNGLFRYTGSRGVDSWDGRRWEEERRHAQLVTSHCSHQVGLIGVHTLTLLRSPCYS
jgi:Type III restriction enzyme, res subunit